VQFDNVHGDQTMYLPRWMYEAKPVAYVAAALIGFGGTKLQPVGAWSAALLMVATCCICYMRYQYRREHRGHS
jgi:hypothetical protein